MRSGAHSVCLGGCLKTDAAGLAASLRYADYHGEGRPCQWPTTLQQDPNPRDGCVLPTQPIRMPARLSLFFLFVRASSSCGPRSLLCLSLFVFFFCLPLFVRRAHANSHEVSEGICALCLDEPTFLFASTLAFYRTLLIIIHNFYIHHQTFLSNRCFKFVFAVRLGMKIKYFRNDNKSPICLKT